MDFLEAFKQLDKPEKAGDYGKVIMKSESRDDLWLFYSQYGINTRSRDWPIPYEIQKEDMEANDWEIQITK